MSRIEAASAGSFSERRVTHRTCSGLLVAVVLLLGSLGLEMWNITVRAPWAPTDRRDTALAADSLPLTKVNPYGVNAFLAGEVEPWKREKTMEMIAASGAGWVKQEFLWSEIEPARGSHWDAKYQQDAWKKYDEIVDLAERYGVRVIARLDHTPTWARPAGTTANTPPSDPMDYANFVAEFVNRYRGRVQYIQVWNEPNLAAEWGGRVDPRGYFDLLKATYLRAKQEDPNVVILGAPMAMTNEHSARAMPELEYWKALYELGAGRYFDVMTASAYGLNAPPTAPPDPSTINMRRIELLHQLMVQVGDGDKSVWLNEYGWDAVPLSIPDKDLLWGRVTEDQQAAWTAEGINWMREHLPWVGVASIWYFRQNGGIPSSAPEYYFRMVDPEFTPREVYLSVQKDATAAQLALPGTYGEMEAPIVAYGTWSRAADPAASDGQYIQADGEGSRIELRFAGSDVDLRLVPGRSHGRLYVELDGRPLKGPELRQDANGRSYISLDSLSTENPLVTVASNIDRDRPQHEHRLRLTVGPASVLSLDGVVVSYRRTYTEFGLYALTGLVGIIGAVVLLKVRR